MKEGRAGRHARHRLNPCPKGSVDCRARPSAQILLAPRSSWSSTCPTPTVIPVTGSSLPASVHLLHPSHISRDPKPASPQLLWRTRLHSSAPWDPVFLCRVSWPASREALSSDSCVVWRSLRASRDSGGWGRTRPPFCFRSYAFQDDTVLPLLLVWKRWGQGSSGQTPTLLTRRPCRPQPQLEDPNKKRIIHTGKGRLGRNSP